MNKSWWIAGFFIVGTLLGAGILLLVTRPPRGEPVQLFPPPTMAPVVVYVNGEVNKPGLLNLPPGSRVNDAIQAAGGFTNEANSSSLNLAEVLVDGEQIHVPALVVLSADQGVTANLIPSMDLVDINSATLEQLDALPEIGPIIAQEIIDYRNANGPFNKIEDIQNVPGIGQAKFDKFKDLITVGTSP